MHQMTELYKQNGHPTLQYYGKWPFTRFMGLQEPASVLFSILNGMNHYKGWKAMRRLPSASEPLKTYYTACGLLGINVWIWSAAFHSRDFSVTEKGDYFSAIGSLLYILFLALIRVFDIQKSQSRHALLGLLGVYFACHVFYLTHWPFDYTYNMAAGVVIGMSSNLTWIYWWIRQRHQRDYAWKQPLLAVLISAAMSLELFDFPPLLGILDAHSLWHMLTIPLVKLHYSFLDSDARYESMVLKGKYRGVPEKDF